MPAWARSSRRGRGDRDAAGGFGDRYFRYHPVPAVPQNVMRRARESDSLTANDHIVNESVVFAAIGARGAFALALGAGRGQHLLAVAGALIETARFASTVSEWSCPDSPANIDDFEVFYGAGRVVLAGQPPCDLAGIRRDQGQIVVYRHAPSAPCSSPRWRRRPSGWRSTCGGC